MNTNELVAKLALETDVNQAYGADKSAKIYKITHPTGHVNFAVSLFEGESLSSCQGDYVSYGAALKVAIEWLDNSEFFL